MTTLKIDFVSDIACPWCAVGLGALEQALARLEGQVQAELHFQPFELNPHMHPGGQDLGEHLTQKYGSTPEQQAQIRQTIAARGAEVGFEFHPGGRGRVYNTFNAHRLLHWAEGQGAGAQHALKKAFLQAYQGRAECVEDAEVLLAGGALAENIFWQVEGGVLLGAGAHIEGVVLSGTSIALGAGASAHGRLLAKTAVTLDTSTVTQPTL